MRLIARIALSARLLVAHVFARVALGAATLLAVAPPARAGDISAGFTYQGRLDVEGQPAEGSFDFRFELAFGTAPDSHLQILHLDDVLVSGGLFSVTLEFASALFNGNDRWLLVSVRPGSHPNADHSAASYTPLLPHQQIRPAPLALYAERAGGLELPIDEHANILGAPCVKIRNDSSIAIAGHSDHGVALYAEAIDGTALMAKATSGWAASFQGKVHMNEALGIGTASLGSFKLAVNGSAAKPGGGSWSTLSDRRTKHDVQPMRGALATLLALRGVTFEYDDAWIERGLALPGRQMGFIAQEVAEVLPEWVESADGEVLCVTERGATALMVEAIRELDARQAAAEQEVASLRRSVEELSRRLDALAR